MLDQQLSKPSTCPPNEQIKVMVVDDSYDFLTVACQWIAQQPRLCVVGTAANGRDALDQLLHLRPDLVLMDVRMPLLDGLQATRWIKSLLNPPVVVLLSVYEVELADLASGADAFANKAEFVARMPQIIAALFDTEVTAVPGSELSAGAD